MNIYHFGELTDMERFIAFYKTLGIDLKADVDEKGNPAIYMGCYDQKLINLFDGYPGFYSVVSFDKDGKFVKQGFWE